MTDIVPYPPAAPTLSGSTLSISAFLNAPLVLRDYVRDITDQRFIGDRIFTPGQNASSVLFNQVTSSPLYADDDAQIIRPGAAFPKTKHTVPNPSLAVVEKYGLEEEATREDIRDNNWPVVSDSLTRIGNTIVRKVNTLAIAALTAAPKQTLTGVDFTSATAAQKVAVFAQAVSLIEDIDFGYDGVQIVAYFNPTQATELVSDTTLLTLLQFEGPTQPARTGNIGRLMGVDSYKSNRVTAGTAWFVAQGIVGTSHQAEGNGVLTNVYYVNESGPQDARIQGWRPITYAVRHPKAAVLVSSI